MHRLIPLSILLTSILIVSIIPGALAADLELEKDLLHGLAKTRAIIVKIEQGQATQADLDQLQALAEDIEAIHLLLDERFRQREEQARSLGGKARNRHDHMWDRYRDALQEYLDLIEDLIAAGGDVGPGVLERIKELIDQISPKKKRPIFGNLPYRNLNYAAQEPLQEPLVIPAYRGGDKSVSPDDTTDTPEAPLSEEIAALAESLDWNPVSLYEWVKNNIETEWYWGCMKGAEETLHQQSGNACDQAALLVALLRASGFPARYVRGAIEFFPDIEQAKEITGIADEHELAAFFQKAGIPSKPVIAGGRIANIQIEHVWVETYVPYANYRGAVIDEHGKTWLALDTAIKVAGYTYNEPQPLPDQVSLADLRQGYLAAVQDVTPLEYLQAQIEAVLPAGTVYADLLATREFVSEVLKILPASLQFKEIAITGEYTQIPADLMHRVRFQATGLDNAELFTVTLNAFQLSNKSIALTYEPETVEDQEIINSWGGLANTPSYLIHLRPVLTVDDERVGVGQDGLSVGQEYNLILELISPNGTESITNTHIIGNLAVIGIVAQGAVVPEEIPFEEKDAQRLLFEQAINYIASWNHAEEELASLMGMAFSRPIPTVVTLGGVVEVTYLLDTPHGFEWRGVYVDADLRAVETASGYGQGAPSEDKVIFMQLSSLQGSVLEHQVLKEAFQVESISTAKLFGLANTNGISIITIDSANIESILPTLPFGENVKEDITDAVNQDLICRIPEAEITYEDWTGVGYLKEDPDTGEAGWMLSGMIAGSMTVWVPSRWDEELQKKLEQAETEPPNTDPQAAYSIHKIPATDRQEGIVGKTLTLQALVLDKDGKPVNGAVVTFTIKAGGGSLKKADDTSDGDGVSTIKVTTGEGKDKDGKAIGSGIAQVQLILGKLTGTVCTSKDCSDKCPQDLSEGNPILLTEGDSYQQVGGNIVDAKLDTGTRAALDSPFIAYGKPGEAAKIIKIKEHETGIEWDILSFAGFISVIVTDNYCNPIVDETVKFVATDVAKQCVSDDEDRLSALLVPAGDPCMEGIPSYSGCSNNESSGAGKKLDVTTSHHGAAVHVFTGAVPNADYPITATCGSFTETFYLKTKPFGNCDDEKVPPSHELCITSVHPADQYGNNINAVAIDPEAQEGPTIEFKARMYFIMEEGTPKPVPVTCDDVTETCPNFIVGTNKYEEEAKFHTASVTFTNTKTGESKTVKTPDDNGIFAHELTVAAGENTIAITGEATSILKERTEKCPEAGIFCENKMKNLEGEEKTTTITIYGVETKFNKEQQLILIDEKGFAVKDFPISYTIEPSQYEAVTAYVVILKDGNVLQHIPAGETVGGGTVTLARGFWFDPNSEYKAQVVLNYGTGVEIRSKEMPLELAQIYIEKKDPDYPDVKLRWNDYYPTLGDKTIVIRGKDGKGNDLNTKKIKAEVVYPAEDHPLRGQVQALTDPTAGAQFDDGKVEVKLAASTVAPPLAGNPDSGLDHVEIRFDILSDDGIKEGEISGTWNIKNNSNTNLQEVIDGEAVFVCDLQRNADGSLVIDDDGNCVANTGENHKSITTGDANNQREVDFVQELLNQVVPRKRGVTYELMSEDGYFGPTTADGVKTFKDEFNVITTEEGSNFRKLIEDYNHENDESFWENKIVDKTLLICTTLRTDQSNNPDNLINSTPGNTRNDTGLYELYENVVKPFVDRIIDEAERYENNATSFMPRGGGGVQTGVSYSYGGDDSLAIYNPSNTVTVGLLSAPANYRGQILTDPNHEYAGMKDDEYNNWVAYFNTVACNANFQTNARDHRHYHQYWAGIDCSGFVQRMINVADPDIPVDHPNDGIRIRVPNIDPSQETCEVKPDGTIWRGRPNRTWVGYYFTDQRVTKYIVLPASGTERTRLLKLLKKGDLVRYGDRHISTVYSDRASQVGNQVRYQIIHPYGTTPYTYPSYDPIKPNLQVFSRKVIRTWQNISSTPTGFGRIKLWEE